MADDLNMDSLMDSIANEVQNEKAVKVNSVEQEEASDLEPQGIDQKKMLELREKSLAVSEAASSVVEPTKAGKENVDDIMSASGSGVRGDISASTIGRMLGLVTAAEFKLLEGKLDLLSTRMNSMLVKMEKVLVMTADMPNGSDLERIDVQLADVRTMLQDIRVDIQTHSSNKPEDKKTGGSILTNQD